MLGKKTELSLMFWREHVIIASCMIGKAILDVFEQVSDRKATFSTVLKQIMLKILRKMFHGRAKIVNYHWIFLILNILQATDYTTFCRPTFLFAFL